MVVTNFFINEQLKFLKHFRGTFSCDNLPDLITNELNLFIVNLDVKSGPGTHFVLMEIKNSKCFYFDSLGEKLLNENIRSYLLYSNVNQTVSKSKQIQSIDSVACGLFAMTICTARCFNLKWNYILSFFSKTNLKRNETDNIIKLLKYISNRADYTKVFIK